MDVNANRPQHALAIQEILAYFNLILIVLLLEVHISMIVSAGRA